MIFDDPEIVEGDHRGQFSDRVRNTKMSGRRADIPVLPAVIAAHQKSVAPGCCAGQSYGRRCGVAAVLPEPHHLRTGHLAYQPFCQFSLKFCREAECDAGAELAAECGVHVRITITQNDGQKSRDKIDILVPVHIPDPSAFAVAEKQRGVVLGILDAAFAERLRAERDCLFRPFEQRLGRGVAPFV